MILLLYGGDEAAIRRRLRELKEEADGGTGMLVNNLAEIEGRDARPEEVIAPAMAPPFLAPLRLVVVEHVLARYEPRGGVRGSRAPAGWAEFPGMVEGVPPTSLIVFVGRPFLAEQQRRLVTDANPLVQLLKKVPGARVEHYPELRGEERVRFIREEAAARGIRFRSGPPPREALLPGEEPPPESDPVVLLANLLGGNTLLIGNELDKLALWSMGREVTVLDVMRVCAGEREPDHFRMVDALMDGDLGTALEMLQLRLVRGEAQQAVLGGVFERYRSLGALAGFLEDGASEEEIDRLLGNVARFPRLKKAAMERARRHGTAGVREAFAILVEADRAFKRNEVDADLALEVAFAGLARLAPVRGPMVAGRRGQRGSGS